MRCSFSIARIVYTDTAYTGGYTSPASGVCMSVVACNSLFIHHAFDSLSDISLILVLAPGLARHNKLIEAPLEYSKKNFSQPLDFSDQNWL